VRRRVRAGRRGLRRRADELGQRACTLPARTRCAATGSCSTPAGTEECDNGANNGPGRRATRCACSTCAATATRARTSSATTATRAAGDGCTVACTLEECGNSVVDPARTATTAERQQGRRVHGRVQGPGLRRQLRAAEPRRAVRPRAALNSDTGECTANCKNAVCGDGLIHANVEQCDDGANNGNNKACKADCTQNVCGDGFVGPGEACDDGNQSNDDACTNVCKQATCGDGFKQAGEECDLGRTTTTPGRARWRASCRPAATVQAAERRGVRRRQPGEHRRVPRHLQERGQVRRHLHPAGRRAVRRRQPGQHRHVHEQRARTRRAATPSCSRATTSSATTATW
jgi:cysteine-rich repeat protein